MLLCDNISFYVGITNNINSRFNEHKKKLNKSTAEFKYIKLVYCERYKNKYQAAIRERQIKGWSRAKKQMLIEGKLGVNTCTELAEELLRGGEVYPE